MTTPSVPHSNSNEVMWADLREATAEAQIDEVIAAYRSHGVAFKWAVYPWTKPADMAERLQRRGLDHWDARAMVAPAALKLRAPTDITVQHITAETLDAYLAVSCAGWELDEQAAEVLSAVSADRLERGVTDLVVASCDGENAASAATLVKPDGTGYLTGANVLPAFRGRGIYRALLHARLLALRERGIEVATTHAREATSAPMLAHLGFETVFRYRLFMGR